MAAFAAADAETSSPASAASNPAPRGRGRIRGALPRRPGRSPPRLAEPRGGLTSPAAAWATWCRGRTPPRPPALGPRCCSAMRVELRGAVRARRADARQRRPDAEVLKRIPGLVHDLALRRRLRRARTRGGTESRDRGGRAPGSAAPRGPRFEREGAPGRDAAAPASGTSAGRERPACARDSASARVTPRANRVRRAGVREQCAHGNDPGGTLRRARAVVAFVLKRRARTDRTDQLMNAIRRTRGDDGC